MGNGNATVRNVPCLIASFLIKRWINVYTGKYNERRWGVAHRSNISICHKCKRLDRGTWSMSNSFTCYQCQNVLKDIVRPETVKKVSVRGNATNCTGEKDET